MPEWLQILGWSAGGVTAVGILWKAVWKGFLQPVSRAAKLLIKALPGIAKEFQPNAGKSLADRVKRIDEGMEAISREAARAKVEAEAAKYTAQKAADAAEKTRDVMTERMAQMAGGQFLIVQRLEAIEARSHQVRRTDTVGVTEMHVETDSVNIQKKGDTE